MRSNGIIQQLFTIWRSSIVLKFSPFHLTSSFSVLCFPRYMQSIKVILLLLVFSVTSRQAKSQFWEIFLEPLFIEGMYYGLFGSPNEPTWQETTFASYPYDLAETGLFLPVDLEGDQHRFFLSSHFQNDEKNTSGGLFQLRYHPISLLLVEANHLQLFENQSNDMGNNVGITSFSINYNRLRHPKIHIWWGGGGLWKSGDNRDGTPILNFGLNYYFKEPLSLYFDYKMGTLNEEFAFLWQARMQMHIRRFVIYGGFQQMDLDDLDLSSWIIGGGFYF